MVRGSVEWVEVGQCGMSGRRVEWNGWGGNDSSQGRSVVDKRETWNGRELTVRRRLIELLTFLHLTARSPSLLHFLSPLSLVAFFFFSVSARDSS